jgi:hypothetical protein
MEEEPSGGSAQVEKGLDEELDRGDREQRIMY